MILITGLNGTVAPRVASVFKQHGASVIGWDRSKFSPEDATIARNFLDELKPDAICHLAMGSENWAALLASHSAKQKIPFLFTSTAMVFNSEPNGPHHPDDTRTSRDEYGLYKIRCEDAVRAANPGAMIARFGWQIDAGASGNNMLAHLDAQQANTGRIEASRLWIPACSYMEDTGAALWELLENDTPGNFHIDSNTEDAWSFDQVAAAMKKHFARDNWKIEINDSYLHDQRLLDTRPRAARLSDRLTPI